MLMVDNKDKNQMTHMIKGLFKSDDEKAEKSEIEQQLNDCVSNIKACKRYSSNQLYTIDSLLRLNAKKGKKILELEAQVRKLTAAKPLTRNMGIQEDSEERSIDHDDLSIMCSPRF